MSVITWADVLARYSELDKLPNVSSTSVQNTLIQYAESSIHSKLSANYSIPFSSNNFTAKDLMVDALYVQNMLTRQPDKTKLLAQNLAERLSALNAGSADMVTSTGELAVVAVGDTIWSSSAEYTPTFGMGDIEKAVVNSAQLLDEAAGRGEFTV